jgi:hypothetical protein
MTEQQLADTTATTQAQVKTDAVPYNADVAAADKRLSDDSF